MKALSILLSFLILAPASGFGQALAEAKAKPAKKAAASADSGGGTPGEKVLPMSTSPAPVTLPSFGGPSSSTLASFGMPPMCGPVERQELDKITSLNMIESQKLSQKLRPVNEEREDAAARYNALYEKQKLELSPLEFELKRMQLESNIQEEKFKKELADLRQQRERLHLQNDLEREKLASEQVKADGDKLKMDLAMRDLDFQTRKLQMDATLADHKTVALKADLDLRSKKEEWKKEANRDPEYPLEPFKDGVLTVSDRRILLDGPIVAGVADMVNDQIHYFNNKDENQPIFIIIDRNPGGSVMEGYRIVKAIQASKAPVHVVVKSYAASMAAVIATLAPHSYAYPNAVILHHQMMSMSFGNLTQQKEQLDIMKKWDKRLTEPVARKMGLSRDEFVKRMYEHNSDGDWEEFGDDAQRLKWVDHVVHEIRETGIVKEPEIKKDEKPKLFFGLAEETDSNGQRFVRLPRLQPYDAYWIDNQDNYYR